MSLKLKGYLQRSSQRLQLKHYPMRKGKKWEMHVSYTFGTPKSRWCYNNPGPKIKKDYSALPLEGK